MNLPPTAPGLTTRTWYRAVDPRYLVTALSTAHTRTIASRYSDASSGNPSFEILYLAEDPMVALFEVGALFGSPTVPGGVIAHPRTTFVVLSVTVHLGTVVDLTDPAAQATMRRAGGPPCPMTAQELTGDWRGYRLRGASTSVAAPIGPAPTQQLGADLHADPRRLEGFETLSAKIPFSRVLVVFPSHLRKTSRLEYRDHGGAIVHQIVGTQP